MADLNPTGLEWRDLGYKRYAMYRIASPKRPATRDGNWGVFGRVEKDASGHLVASCTQFEHIKYVESFEDGVNHVEAIWALGQEST